MVRAMSSREVVTVEQSSVKTLVLVVLGIAHKTLDVVF
jgi:hypothetical protein